MGVLTLIGSIVKGLPGAPSVRLAQYWINREYGRYGTMTQLKIDSASKTIDLEMMLNGEQEPVAIHVGKYELSPAGELRLSGISVSRAWMNLLAQELLADKPLAIPPEMVKWLGMVM